MPRIVLRPSFSKDLDGLLRSWRKHYQRASKILLEIQRDIEPSAPRRTETRIPKCHKYELPDGYRPRARLPQFSVPVSFNHAESCRLFTP
jgi:hypothetical protein